VIDVTSFVAQVSSFKLRFYYSDGGMTSPENYTYLADWAINDLSVVVGDFEILGETEDYPGPAKPSHVESNDGCDSGPACESLAGHTFGSGDESLGWFYNGKNCQEAKGTSGEGNYCFFETNADCARSCTAAEQCNMEAFVGRYWPERGAEVASLAEGTFDINGTADDWDVAAQLWEDDHVYPMPFDSPTCSEFFFPDVLRCGTWPAMLAISMTWDTAWERLCGYSLVGDNIFITWNPPRRGTPR